MYELEGSFHSGQHTVYLYLSALPTSQEGYMHMKIPFAATVKPLIGNISTIHEGAGAVYLRH